MDAVNLINVLELSFDTVIVNESADNLDFELNGNNTQNLNNELESVLENENIPNPLC